MDFDDKVVSLQFQDTIGHSLGLCHVSVHELGESGQMMLEKVPNNVKSRSNVQLYIVKSALP